MRLRQDIVQLIQLQFMKMKKKREAISIAGVPREELFITSKVWNTDQGYDETLRAFEASLEKLDLDYLDLYLTHWPVKDKLC